MKRNKRKIYGALGEYILNGDSTLLNKEQLEIANQYKPNLQQLLKKSKRERKLIKLKQFIKKIPSYILYGISGVAEVFIIPLQWISYKCDEIGVAHENKINFKVHKLTHEDELNTFAYNKVLPLLEKAETDDMLDKHEEWMNKRRLNKK